MRFAVVMFGSRWRSIIFTSRSSAQGIELARDFVQAEFVDQGMIADLNVHWDMAEDGMPKPHAHIMLTMRSVEENGFAHKSASGQGAIGYHQQALLVPKARFSTILRHTNIGTNKVARLG